jgi:hypothetical protein
MNACTTMAEGDEALLEHNQLKALMHLAAIRDLHLYRGTHATFEAWFEDKFGALPDRFFGGSQIVTGGAR